MQARAYKYTRSLIPLSLVLTLPPFPSPPSFTPPPRQGLQEENRLLAEKVDLEVRQRDAALEPGSAEAVRVSEGLVLVKRKQGQLAASVLDALRLGLQNKFNEEEDRCGPWSFVTPSLSLFAFSFSFARSYPVFYSSFLLSLNTTPSRIPLTMPPPCPHHTPIAHAPPGTCPCTPSPGTAPTFPWSASTKSRPSS